MAIRIRLNLVLVAAHCVIILQWNVAVAQAEEGTPPKIEPISLTDFDVSHEIREVAKHANRPALKPLRKPGYEELRHALRSESPNIVAALLSVGADPNAKSQDGTPILFRAVRAGYVERIEDLLKAGTDPNLVDQHGTPLLDRAVWSEEPEVVSLLLKYGAAPSRKNKYGRTVLENAKRYGNKEIIALLEAKPGKHARLTPIQLPTVLRQPDAEYGSRKFSAAGGGQALIYTPDNRQLVAGDARGGIRFFDAVTGEIKNVLNAHEGEILGLTFIPKSRILVSAAADRTVRFWDIDTFRELKRLKGHWGQAKALSVSPNGRFLNTGWFVWEIESVKPLKLAARARELKHPKYVGILWSFFTPDNRYLVLSRNFTGIWVWDLVKDTMHQAKGLDQKSLREVRWKDLAKAVDIRMAKPTDLLALVKDQYTILTGSPETLNEFERAVRSVNEQTRALARSPHGQYLAALGYNSRIEVHDLENGSKFQHEGHRAAVHAVAVSPDGKLIASGGNDSTVRIWNRKTRKQLEVIPVHSFVYSVCFSPDGKLLGIGDNSGRVYLWDIADKSLQSYGTSGWVTDLAFDPRGIFLASLSFEIQLLDLKNRKVIMKTSALDASQGNMALSPDGKLVVGSARSMGASETFKVPSAWAIDDDRLFPNNDLFSEAMGHRYMIHAVAFSPDNTLLAASSQQAIRLWDMKKRKPVGGKLCGHTVSVGDMKFSPDGKWLASASWDGTARVWEIPSGRQAIVINADVDRVTCVDFTPTGELITANWDGTVHLWKLAKLKKK